MQTNKTEIKVTAPNGEQLVFTGTQEEVSSLQQTIDQFNEFIGQKALKTDIVKVA